MQIGRVGSGDVWVADAGGDVSVDSIGSGDISVDVVAGNFHVGSKGSGNVAPSQRARHRPVPHDADERRRLTRTDPRAVRARDPMAACAPAGTSRRADASPAIRSRRLADARRRRCAMPRPGNRCARSTFATSARSCASGRAPRRSTRRAGASPKPQRRPPSRCSARAISTMSPALLHERVREPFTLVHFDNHPDWVRLAPRWHCGSWLNRTLALPNLQRAITLGPCSDDLVNPGHQGRQSRGARLRAASSSTRGSMRRRASGIASPTAPATATSAASSIGET